MRKKKSFHYLEADIPWKEKEKIRHEINNVYARYDGLSVIAHRSVGLDNHYYIYYVENHGFDDYNIFMRVEDIDEEE